VAGKASGRGRQSLGAGDTGPALAICVRPNENDRSMLAMRQWARSRIGRALHARPAYQGSAPGRPLQTDPPAYLDKICVYRATRYTVAIQPQRVSILADINNALRFCLCRGRKCLRLESGDGENVLPAPNGGSGTEWGGGIEQVRHLFQYKYVVPVELFCRELNSCGN
tara:strand:- start:1067 stop:1570 length:504 start_codon:yes stop_codon:yes gene_type:complete